MRAGEVGCCVYAERGLLAGSGVCVCMEVGGGLGLVLGLGYETEL